MRAHSRQSAALAARLFALCLGANFAAPNFVLADAFDGYRLAARFDLPPGAGPMDCLPDGRVVAIVGDDIFVESAAGSRVFASAGMMPAADIASFGAAFLRVSPDGSKIAVGNNGGADFATFQVGIFDFPSLTGDWYTAAHFDAEWVDATHVALTAGDFGSPAVVTVLDTTSPDPGAPINPVVIENIGGASGGVAIDELGNLYTGNGFTTSGPSGTGAIKAFAAADWNAVLGGSPALDFESGGTLVVDVLSAAPLGFDAEGNLYVGGGDFSKEGGFDFVALVRASAIDDALAGFGPANANDSNLVRRLDPEPEVDANFFSVNFNTGAGELYVRDARVHVYRDLMGVPTVGEWGLCVMSLLTLTAGTLVIRRTPTGVA